MVNVRDLKSLALKGLASSILAGGICCVQPTSPVAAGSADPQPIISTWSYSTNTIESPQLNVACYGSTVFRVDSTFHGSSGRMAFYCITPISSFDSAVVDSAQVEFSKIGGDSISMLMVAPGKDSIVSVGILSSTTAHGDSINFVLTLAQWGRQQFTYGKWEMVKQ